MRLLLILFTLFLLSNCSKNKTVFWCGDHACANDKERIAYFEKTMIVEIKDVDKKSKKDFLNKKKMLKQSRKEIKKQARLDKKIKHLEEKELKKQARLEEKMKGKNEKKLKKQIDIKNQDEDLIFKNDNKQNKTKMVKKHVSFDSNNIDLIYETLMNSSKGKPFPDINNFPE